MPERLLRLEHTYPEVGAKSTVEMVHLLLERCYFIDCQLIVCCLLRSFREMAVVLCLPFSVFKPQVASSLLLFAPLKNIYNTKVRSSFAVDHFLLNSLLFLVELDLSRLLFLALLVAMQVIQCQGPKQSIWTKIGQIWLLN